MKPRTYGLKSLLILLVTFVVIMTIAILSGCLCAAILVYLKNGSFIFGWQEDVLFQLKEASRRASLQEQVFGSYLG